MLRAVLLIITILLPGCSNPHVRSACIATGICDPTPPPAVLIEIACDSTDGSACTAATLRQTCDLVLPRLAQAPGSLLRVWTFGEDLSDIRPVVAVRVPVYPSGRGAALVQQKRWIEQTRTLVDAAGAALFSHAVFRKSRIVEALGEIGRADNPEDLPVTIIYEGDRLEQSAYGSFECHTLPNSESFIHRVAAAGIITKHSFSHVHVVFAYGNASRHPCASLARDRQVEDLWRALITAGGGTAEFYQDAFSLKGASL